MVIPLAAGRRGLDGDTTFLLLLHEVGGRLAIMNLTGLVDLARQLEDTLCGRGLAGIYVRKDPDIPVRG